MCLRKLPFLIANREYELAKFRAKTGRMGEAYNASNNGAFLAAIRVRNMAPSDRGRLPANFPILCKNHG